ncbi:NPCBM/NEW2 domain-containing protein [Paenibacillus xerothermodurans]|uniref:Alpha-galactosidase n=1 Tax=Paenibacillus xerothermodurans TaxID=1977292 RepID=A0A2W1N9H6_PAEXE|nr:NPCBM/NEW2 domain-containing protein [Paenibacillus xerothermodurans]PZE21067.1 alpha-galactosidase [Paenibacillus xerothermodurans]
MKRTRSYRFFLTVFLTIFLSSGILWFRDARPVNALDNGLAETPPMGWNSWNKFGCNINENLIKEMADSMAASGMKEAGYEYVNIDDCWMAPTRDANGDLQADPDRFPNGIKALADYVHSKGLKLGIYEDAGTKTCKGLPGSYGHYEQDARKFAEWGVDYLKFDWCYATGLDAETQYTQMKNALSATGREIVFSICNWGEQHPWVWGPQVGHLWRTTADISDRWDSVMSILDQQVGLESYAGPGHWNDPDMLEVGNGGMTADEYRAHFSLWSVLAAPLIAGNDLRSMSDATKEILLNKEVIAVDQDPAGLQGKKIEDDGDHEIWMRPLADGDRAVVFLNRGSRTTTMSIHTAALGLDESAAYIVRDLWAHQETAVTGVIDAVVPAHGTTMFRISQGQADKSQPSVALAQLSTDLIVPGKPTEVTMTLANNGFTDLREIDVMLDAPDQWIVRPKSDTTLKKLSNNKHKRTMEVTWEITVPQDANAGADSLTVNVSYSHGSKKTPNTVTFPLSVQIPPAAPAADAFVSDLPFFGSSVNGWRSIQKDKSVGGKPITLNGVTYDKGLGVHSHSEVSYYLGGNVSAFTADVGVDDEERDDMGSVNFQIWADGKIVYDSGLMVGESPAQHVNIATDGVNVLRLVVTNGGNGMTDDHADWANARFTVKR